MSSNTYPYGYLTSLDKFCRCMGKVISAMITKHGLVFDKMIRIFCHLRVIAFMTVLPARLFPGGLAQTFYF